MYSIIFALSEMNYANIVELTNWYIVLICPFRYKNNEIKFFFFQLVAYSKLGSKIEIKSSKRKHLANKAI